MVFVIHAGTAILRIHNIGLTLNVGVMSCAVGRVVFFLLCRVSSVSFFFPSSLSFVTSLFFPELFFLLSSSFFLHHVLLAGDLAEFVDTVDQVLVGDEASLTWVTVTADVHGRAWLGNLSLLLVTESTVDGASLIGDFVVGHPLESVVGLTTVATKVLLLARDDDLGGDVDIGPGGLTGDLYPIRDGGGGGVGPA